MAKRHWLPEVVLVVLVIGGGLVMCVVVFLRQ